ncbi:ethanolamine-phosphate cytidylyltransferase-like isoform X2 [Lycium barbarum]|uniref:ethanolamine-phosphate cytidylyltransferase-like isoform X2 n=1 Tax=Lycium barbarum TaxID=112863 RepID=UPI00293E974B|nr:ethanolamine-phosphate cytidylyltransferase-like isoform X2 [Lycium barbarum]
MDFESNNWVWEGMYYYPRLFGGIMLTAALLGLSTSYFGGISLLYPFPDLSIFHKKKHEKKRVRVYMDGCFDLMHYGHANALRQAKALGDELVVGVVSDEEIIATKGPPVLCMEERLALVSGLKWVDEVISSAPYAITEDFMNRLFNEYKIDYIIHGDDPCLLPDGTDAYALAKKAGRYKQIKRTEGVSSTDICVYHRNLQRQLISHCQRSMLLDDTWRILSSAKSTPQDYSNSSPTGEADDIKNKCGAEKQAKGGQISHFLPTSRRIVQFSNGKGPAPNSRVVYIDGAFDLFHAGHVEILRSARQLGDFLLAGIYPDPTVSELRGHQYPLMNLYERSLGVLACRYVDEVIIGAPWEVTQDMGRQDPYAVPKSMGIFQVIESPKDITTSSVAQRIIANHEIYVKRNTKKAASEKKFYAERKYVSGD